MNIIINKSPKDAHQTLRDVKRHHHEHRHDHLVQLAYAIDEANTLDQDNSSTLKQLRKHEDSMRRLPIIQQVMGKRTGYM
jgi:hypothetical protein